MPTMFEQHKAANPKPAMVIASSDAKLNKELHNLSLADVGLLLGLQDSDIRIAALKFRNVEQPVKYFGIKLNGTEHFIPMSRGLVVNGKLVKEFNPKYAMDCVFRSGFKWLVDDEGELVLDENDKEQPDLSAPYLSFGKPAGSFEVAESFGFGENLTADDLVGATTVATPKAADNRSR